MERALSPLFAFNNSESDQGEAVLALHFGKSHVSYAVKNRSNGILQSLQYFQVDLWDPSHVDFWVTPLEPVLRTTPQVEIAFSFSDLSALPVAGFSEVKLKALHQSIYPFRGPAFFRTETIAAWQLYLGYPIPLALYQKCESLFPHARKRHAFKLMLDASGQSTSAGKLMVELGIEEFHLVLVKNNRLQFFQTFLYENPADVLFQLLTLCENQQISPSEVEVVLSGLLEKDSALYRELWQYFMHVQFRDTPFRVGEFPYPPHYFTILNDLLACAS